MLDRDRALRGQLVKAAVEMRAESNPGLGDGSAGGERHDLISAGIGQDGVRPIHEAVQSAQCGDALRPGAKHQVIGVAKDDPRPGSRDPVRRHRLDRAGSADRHEDRGVDDPVSSREPPAPRRAVAR